MRPSLAILLAAMLVFPFNSIAGTIRTMTFSDVGFVPGINSYTEDGITAETLSDGIYSWEQAGAIHLDRLESWPPAVNFHTQGSLFVPISIKIDPMGSGYCSDPNANPEFVGDFPSEGCEFSSFNDPIPYIWLSGFLNNSLVSTIGLFIPSSSGFLTFNLEFMGAIDLLRVEARTYADLGLPGACSDGFGCGHFDVDDVTIASVPEPGSLSLIAAGLGGVALLRRRKVRTRP